MQAIKQLTYAHALACKNHPKTAKSIKDYMIIHTRV